jgi:NAD(P)H-dependent FMN reductase
LALRLLPGLPGRYENDLVETEATGNLAGRDQVAVVDRIKRATHDAKPVPLMRLGTALPGQACRARWQGHAVALAMRATPADRPGDQQQDEEQTERNKSEERGRNR